MHDLKNKNVGVSCVECGTEEEVNTHVMVCKHYKDLRQGLDFNNEKGNWQDGNSNNLIGVLLKVVVVKTVF